MHAPHLTLTLFLSTCLLLRAAEPAPAPPVLDALPQEIGQFYIDANFVSCFSTAEERQLVDLALRRGGTDQAPSGRLGMVMRMTQRLRESFHEVDPQFVRWVGGNTQEDGQMIQAVSVQEGANEIRVTTQIWTVAKERSVLLVSQYDHQEEALKTLATIQQGKSRTEVHLWKKHGPRWLRDGAVIVPLRLGK
jgi:hypothetical protein|uniref:hypothetical protein n=1 Tax=Prosthecobacter sp. TaxID=1965333 RepID=UPI0037848233